MKLEIDGGDTVTVIVDAFGVETQKWRGFHVG